MALARRHRRRGCSIIPIAAVSNASGDYQRVLAQHGICVQHERGRLLANAVAESFSRH